MLVFCDLFTTKFVYGSSLKQYQNINKLIFIYYQNLIEAFYYYYEILGTFFKHFILLLSFIMKCRGFPLRNPST